LKDLGWSDGRNVRINTRWGENDVNRTGKYAAELVALASDIVLASRTVSVVALQHVCQAVRVDRI
jgi:putative ABC transport system substrate-binding protein